MNVAVFKDNVKITGALKGLSELTESIEYQDELLQLYCR